MKAISLVHVLAQLAIKFVLFEENERGGLLVDNGYSLMDLAYIPHSSYIEEHNQIIDNFFLA